MAGETNPLSALPPFRRHLSDVSERCETDHTPERQLATIIGNYNLLT